MKPDFLILTIRTDNPEAEIGLYAGSQEVAYETWAAHRELSNTMHIKIRDILASQHKESADIKGIVCFVGPGSFTGLRMGLTVANAFAESLGIPIVGAQGENWQQNGTEKLLAGSNDKLVLPVYI